MNRIAGFVSRRIGRRPAFYFLLIATLCTYLNLFIAPRRPIYRDGDGSIYLLEATRMLQGQVIYRDFFEFIFPGTQWIYLFFFKLFGVRAWIPNALLVGQGVGLTWLITTISRRVLPGVSAFLPGSYFFPSPFFLRLTQPTIGGALSRSWPLLRSS